jgi:hypothetical protein
MSNHPSHPDTVLYKPWHLDGIGARDMLEDNKHANKKGESGGCKGNQLWK